MFSKLWCVIGLKRHEGRHLLIYDLCFEAVGALDCGMSVSDDLEGICKGAFVTEPRTVTWAER
jgi:hypothetical protein